MATIEQLRAIYNKEENRTNNEPRQSNYYPFWNMKVGERAVVRFLPDKNESNPMGFLVEKLMHTLEINGEVKSVPCLKMKDATADCPICKVSSEYYKSKNNVLGKKYYKKKQYIGQVLVIEDPLPANEETGEKHTGKVRLITLGYQLYNVIKEAFKDPETLPEVPYSFDKGTDFIIKKTQQGEYSTYAVGSRFANKQRELVTNEMSIALEGMVDLATLLPRDFGKDKTEAMLEAALTGKALSEATHDDHDDVDTPPAEAVIAPSVAASDDEEVDKMLAEIRGRKPGKKS